MLDMNYWKIYNSILVTAALLLVANAHLHAATTEGCLASSGSWANVSLSQTETANFRVAYDAIPSAATMNAIGGLSSAAAHDYTRLAAAARFNPSGMIDVRNGSSFTAATSVRYSAGATYHFILDVNVSTHKYNAYVLIGSAQTTLGTNLAFRSEQATVNSLNNVGLLSALGTLSICNITVSTPPAITTQPLSQTLALGQKATFSVAAMGTAPLAYQWKKNGVAISGARSSTYTTPIVTNSDAGLQFSVVVSNSAGTVTSKTAILTIGSATLLLNASTTSLSFGKVSVSHSSDRNLTLTNVGTSNVTISKVSVTGAGFNASGGASGLILSPQQSTTVRATFAPSTTGTHTGTITVSSNAKNSPATIALSGIGVVPAAHSVSLSWNSSDSGVVGYNIYVGSISGGPYSKLTATPVNGTAYVDDSVQSGRTYYYVATSVNSTNVESRYSAEVEAVIP
jgi:hypothetical protein